MSQVIAFETETGNVAICIPTGELPIEAVLQKDCPGHAFIIDQSKLPNQDNDFFDAWEMDAKTVSVNLDKAKEITLAIKGQNLKVQCALQERQIRVTGKKRDDLQSVIRFLRTRDFGVGLAFQNFRD